MRESPYAPANTKENENYTHYLYMIKCKQGQQSKKGSLNTSDGAGLSFRTIHHWRITVGKKIAVSIGENGDTRLVDSVIDLAKNMRLKIIAEGVETKAQADYLRRKQIDFLQGYYFFKPLPASELIHQIIARDRVLAS